MTALLLAAVGGSGRQTCVALAANLLLAVVFLRQQRQRRFDDTASQPEDLQNRSTIHPRDNLANGRK